MQRPQELKHGNQDRLRRDHHRSDEGVEDHLASWKSVAREGVGCRWSPSTWRLPSESDAAWGQFGCVHEAEMFLIKGMLER
jgi:hypothetical protein